MEICSAFANMLESLAVTGMRNECTKCKASEESAIRNNSAARWKKNRIVKLGAAAVSYSHQATFRATPGRSARPFAPPF